MTREKIIIENNIITHLPPVTKLFLEIEFQLKGNKQMKKANSQQNLAVFLDKN